MKPNQQRTSDEKKNALEERDRSRQLLEATWSRIEPELNRLGHAGRYSTERRDSKIVLIFDGRTPVDVRPLLEAQSVSELFALDVNKDEDEEVWELGVELREALHEAGFESHRYSLDEDGTGPLVFLTYEPDSVRARQADLICERFAAAHKCGASWEYDPGGPGYALLPP